MNTSIESDGNQVRDEQGTKNKNDIDAEQQRASNSGGWEEGRGKRAEETAVSLAKDRKMRV